MPVRIEATSVMELLKQSTQEQHRAVERALDLSNPHFTIASYRRLLERFYGYYLPWEAGCREALDPSLHGFFEARLKSPLIERDLVVLGCADIAAVPQCGRLPVLMSTDDALGSMYVVEGSTLGGRLLSRHFAAVLGIDSETGGRFFAGNGEQTGRMWREFGALVEEHVETPADAVTSAQKTFETLRDWLVIRG